MWAPCRGRMQSRGCRQDVHTSQHNPLSSDGLIYGGNLPYRTCLCSGKSCPSGFSLIVGSIINTSEIKLQEENALLYKKVTLRKRLTFTNALLYNAIMDLKTLFKNSRKLLGLNQKEFAMLIGVSQASVSRYERGLVQPSAKTLIEIQSLTRGE